MKDLFKHSREIEDLLMSEEYQTTVYRFDKGELTETELEEYRLAGKMNGVTGLPTLVDDLSKLLERVPTQKEVGKRGLELVTEYYKTKLDKDACKGALYNFRYRVTEAYKSTLIEIHTELKLKELYPDAEIVTHDLIDFAMGVDVVFKDTYSNKVQYFHITRDSQWSAKHLKNKESRQFRVYKDGKQVGYKRCFINHINLLYGGSHSKLVGGVELFTDEYLKMNVEHGRQSKYKGDSMDKTTQLEDFKRFLRVNGLTTKNFGL